MVRSADRGISREGGPESAFRLACALEGAGVVVMDAGAGLIGAKVLPSATTGEHTTVMSSYVSNCIFAQNTISLRPTDALRYFSSPVSSRTSAAVSAFTLCYIHRTKTLHA